MTLIDRKVPLPDQQQPPPEPNPTDGRSDSSSRRQQQQQHRQQNQDRRQRQHHSHLNHNQYLHAYDSAAPPSYGSIVAAESSSWAALRYAAGPEGRADYSSEGEEEEEEQQGASSSRHSVASRRAASSRHSAQSGRRSRGNSALQLPQEPLEDLEGGSSGASHMNSDTEEQSQRTQIEQDRQEERTQERTPLLGFWRRRRSGLPRSKRRKGNRSWASIVTYLLIIILLAILISELIDVALGPDLRVSPPPPYLLPDGSAKVVELIELDSPIPSHKSGDDRIPSGLFVVQSRVILSTQSVATLLFHSVGGRYSGLVSIKGATDAKPQVVDILKPFKQASKTANISWQDVPWDWRGTPGGMGPRPDPKDPANHLVYINVTAVASNHFVLENTLTLARISAKGAIGITLASDLHSWADPRSNDVFVYVDIRMPVTLTDLAIDVATDRAAIDATDIGSGNVIPGEDNTAFYHAQAESVSLVADQGKITTGHVLAKQDIRVQTGRGDVTAIGIMQSFNGSIDVRTTTGVINIGALLADEGAAYIGLREGALISQVLEAQQITIETDTASIRGYFIPLASFSATSNTGDMDLTVWPTAVASACDVKIRNGLGSVQVQYENQRKSSALFSDIKGRMGKVLVRHSPTFQGDVFVSNVAAPNLVSIRVPSAKRFHEEPLDPRFSKHVGSVWLDGHEPHDGKTNWGKSTVETLTGPITVEL